jgi:hypothetical protein
MLNFKEWLINEAKGSGIDSYVKDGMIDLFHYNSSNENSIILSPDFFGKSFFSKREMASASTKRIFFYVDIVDKEHFFNALSHLFRASVPRNQIIDLSKDEGGYIKKSKENNYGALNIDMVLQSIIEDGYKGVFYDNGMYLVNWFEPIKVYQVSEEEVLRELGHGNNLKDAKEIEKKRYLATFGM